MSREQETLFAIAPRASDSRIHQVHIRFAGFIPCQALALGDVVPHVGDLLTRPLSWIGNFRYIGGDARSFDFTLAGTEDRARGMVSVLFERRTNGDARLASVSKHAGLVKGFRDDQIGRKVDRVCYEVRGAGTGTNWHPTPAGTKQASTEHMHAELTHSSDHGYDRYVIRITMETYNELTPGTTLVGASFSADATIQLNYPQDSFLPTHWTVEGHHDGFPNFEIYVSDWQTQSSDPPRVYEYDLHNFSATALDLLGDKEVGFQMQATTRGWPPAPLDALRYGHRWGTKR